MGDSFFVTIGHFGEFGPEKIVFDFFCEVLPGKRWISKEKKCKFTDFLILSDAPRWS